MIPDFPAGEVCTPDVYRKLITEKAYTEARLEEALYVTGVREETIALLEAKIRELNELNSRIGSKDYEINTLQHLLGEQQNRAHLSFLRETGLLEELSTSARTEQEMGSLREKCAHLEYKITVLTRDADELAVINKELIQELGKVTGLESALENAKAENALLQQKLLLLEERIKQVPVLSH